MKGRARLMVFSLVAVLVLVLGSCKPIPYYLEKVCKAYGTVTDARTKAPIESVEVTLDDYQYSELTNGLGDYEIELAEGTWTLNFVRDGYMVETRQVTVSTAAPRKQVDVVLAHAGFTLSGAWPSPDGAPILDGVFGYLKLVTGGQPTDPAVYWAQSTTPFSGGATSYSIPGIEAGSYTVWAFIDANGDALNDPASLPDQGDWFLMAGIPITISGNQTLNFASNAWTQGQQALSPFGTWQKTSWEVAPGLVFSGVTLTLGYGTLAESGTDPDGVYFSFSGAVDPPDMPLDTPLKITVTGVQGQSSRWVAVTVGNVVYLKLSNLTPTEVDLWGGTSPDSLAYEVTLTRL